jgi:hypothetical protein
LIRAKDNRLFSLGFRSHLFAFQELLRLIQIIGFEVQRINALAILLQILSLGCRRGVRKDQFDNRILTEGNEGALLAPLYVFFMD